jgi:hypothetical protein
MTSDEITVELSRIKKFCADHHITSLSLNRGLLEVTYDNRKINLCGKLDQLRRFCVENGVVGIAMQKAPPALKRGDYGPKLPGADVITASQSIDFVLAAAKAAVAMLNKIDENGYGNMEITGHNPFPA